MFIVFIALFIAVIAILAIYFGLWSQLLVHETGQRMMRAVCNIPTSMVEVGIGPCILRVGTWTLRVLPIAGRNGPLSYCLPVARWRKTLVLLGGVGLNGAVAMGLAMMMMAYHHWAWIIGWFAGFQALGLLQLFPFRTDQGMASDGLFLVAIWCNLRFCPPHPCGSEFVDAPCDGNYSMQDL